ncbi:hypothetical protein GCM10027088_22820 [Nocardia goodfellowii]
MQHQRERPAAIADRVDAGPDRDLTFEIETGGREGRQSSVERLGLDRDRLTDQHRLQQHHLLGEIGVGSVDRREDRPQHLVPRHHVLQRRTQRIHVDGAAHPYDERHVVIRAALEPVQKPDALLGR